MSGFTFNEPRKYLIHTNKRKNTLKTPRRKLEKVEEDPEMESMKCSDDEELKFNNICIVDPDNNKMGEMTINENDEDMNKEEQEEDLFLPVVPGPTKSKDQTKINHQKKEQKQLNSPEEDNDDSQLFSSSPYRTKIIIHNDNKETRYFLPIEERNEERLKVKYNHSKKDNKNCNYNVGEEKEKTKYYLPTDDDNKDESDNHNKSHIVKLIKANENKKKRDEEKEKYYLPTDDDKEEGDGERNNHIKSKNNNKRNSVELDVSDDINCYENYDKIKNTKINMISSEEAITNSETTNPNNYSNNSNNSNRNSNSNYYHRRHHKRNSQNTEYRINKRISNDNAESQSLSSSSPIHSPSVKVEEVDDEFNYTEDYFKIDKLKKQMKKHKHSKSFPTLLLDQINNQNNNYYSTTNINNNNNTQDIDYGELYKVKPYFRKPSLSYTVASSNKKSKNKVVPFILTNSKNENMNNNNRSKSMKEDQTKHETTTPNSLTRNDKSKTTSSKRFSSGRESPINSVVPTNKINQNKEQEESAHDLFNFNPDEDDTLTKCLICVFM